MSSMSDNIPNPAPHEDALAQARAAVIQVLTSTAEQRDHILREATTEREGLLSGAQSEATSIVDQARGSAAQLREQAEADAATTRERAETDAEAIRTEARSDAEAILNEARGAAERIRGDAAAQAHHTRTTADAEAAATIATAMAVAEQVRAGLAELRAVETQLAGLTGQGPDSVAPDLPPPPGATAQVGAESEDAHPAAEQTEASEDEASEDEATASERTPDGVQEDPGADTANEAPAPPTELTEEQFDDFMRQLAQHLDILDRARSTGDRDEVGRVLHDLGDLAGRSQARELAELANHLGPDARPEELDELIRQCYQVRQGLPAVS